MGYVEIIKNGLVTTIENDKVTTTPARRCDRCNKDRSTVDGRYYNWSDGNGWDWYCAECKV
jgi:hypothetical protein